jgi:predicted phage gp36 major capsid-like protein
MREAQKMMEDPEFKKQMKQMTANPAFKDHMQKTQEVLKDPEKVKEMEDKMQKALKEGEEALTKAQAERDAKGDKIEDGDKKEAAEEDGDKKEAAKDDEDEIPDMPSLNLN